MPRLDPHSWCDNDQPRQRHLSLTLTIDFRHRVVHGIVRIDIDGPAGGPLDLDSRDLSVHSVTDQDGQDIHWHIAESETVRGDRIRIHLRDGTSSLTLTYTTAPGAKALCWLGPQQTAGGQHPFIFSQCHPIHARTLVPCQDTPRHRVTYDAHITVPAPLRALMSASDKGHEHVDDGLTWHFQMLQAIPTYLLALAVGNLDVREVSPRCRVYAEPETVEQAAWEFAGTEDMIISAERLFGPYVWDRFDLLVMPPAFPYGGMENPRLTFLTPTLLAGDRSQVNVVAHELAHSWAGNLVTNATMDDFWLNEGFTVYAERRILEEVAGKAFADLHAVLRRNALQTNLDQFEPDSRHTRLRNNLAGIDPDKVYSLVPYEKGAQLIRLLEDAVGRAAFDEFLRKYFARFCFQSITTDEFLAFLEQELPGTYIRVRGPEWVDGPGMPDNELPIDLEAAESLRTLAAGWSEGLRPTPDATTAWTPAEWQLYLQGLPRRLPAAECQWLDESFELTARGNYEVLVEWLTIAATSAYKPALPKVRDVLANTGRMKYLNPLYRALMSNAETRALAREVFADVKDKYHMLSRSAVYDIING